MHGTEDDPMFDGPQQFFVGFEKGRKTMEVGGPYLKSLSARSIPPASDTVASLTIVLIYGFAACDIGRILLRLEKRRE